MSRQSDLINGTFTDSIDVTGTVTADGLTVGSSSVSAGTGLFQQIETAGNNMYVGIGSNNSAYVQANGEFRIATGGYQDKVTVTTSGNVGIGTSSPKSFSGQTHVTVNHPSGGTNVSGYSLRVADTEYSSLITYPSNSEGLRIATVTALPMTFQTNNTERMRIDSSGYLLVGKPANNATTQGINMYPDGAAYYISDGTGAFDCVRFYRNGTGATVGRISTTGTATSYVTSSDYRLKTDAQPMTGASDRVLALKPVNFAWIVDGSRVDGFLAHEAQEVVPECVTGTKDAMRDEEYEVTAAVEATYDEDGNELTAAVPAVMGTRSVPDMQGIDQSKLVPLLTAALQEALTEISALKVRVAALEAN